MEWTGRSKRKFHIIKTFAFPRWWISLPPSLQWSIRHCWEYCLCHTQLSEWHESMGHFLPALGGHHSQSEDRIEKGFAKSLISPLPDQVGEKAGLTLLTDKCWLGSVQSSYVVAWPSAPVNWARKGMIYFYLNDRSELIFIVFGPFFPYHGSHRIASVFLSLCWWHLARVIKSNQSRDKRMVAIGNEWQMQRTEAAAVSG